jgi:hypothetical protein
MDHLKVIYIDWRNILKRILVREMGGQEMYSYGSGDGQVAVSCECCDDHSVSVKCGEFLDYLRMY